MMRLALFSLLAVASAQPDLAVAQDDPACGKFADPLPYNACLAARGPKATDIATYDGQAPPTSAASASSARIYTQPARRRYWSASRRRGRIHMEFRVK